MVVLQVTGADIFPVLRVHGTPVRELPEAVRPVLLLLQPVPPRGEQANSLLLGPRHHLPGGGGAKEL